MNNEAGVDSGGGHGEIVDERQHERDDDRKVMENTWGHRNQDVQVHRIWQNRRPTSSRKQRRRCVEGESSNPASKVWNGTLQSHNK